MNAHQFIKKYSDLSAEDSGMRCMWQVKLDEEWIPLGIGGEDMTPIICDTEHQALDVLKEYSEFCMNLAKEQLPNAPRHVILAYVATVLMPPPDRIRLYYVEEEDAAALSAAATPANELISKLTKRD